MICGGSYKIPSSCGANYFLTIVDDYSRSVWVYVVKNKNDVPGLIKNYFAMIKRQLNKYVKVVRSDNGKEFTCLKEYFAEIGIIHQMTCVGTSQQNGKVERKHRHILNVARALMFQAHLPINFWGKYILAAGYLINRTPTKLLQGKLPFQFILTKHLHMITYVFSGVYVMLDINDVIMTNLLVIVASVSLLDILMVKRDGNYMILKQKNILFLEM